ncbi:serine/threonine protein kinase [Nonomuraea guangzhouensis]|uniref:Serine/threonine protein kinase n=1 Tax=Nonomuraea guangzhouensis TaxID=1291555 RepID=A0ABW4G717_9ACTN|nr:serine/threonine-protein kinase [Nonomuraea guangzhouensis]
MPYIEPLREGDPAVVGAYRITGRLGAGGQGVVYLGQAADGKPVAVKVLREVAAGDDRLAREIAAARRVEPFCIAQVLDASMGGRPYIVSEYVDGPSLQQAGRHTGGDLQRLAVSTATALAAIHAAGIVHRDFKPANVLLGRDGPRVIDFGVARATDSVATGTATIVGTPAYMAPEQLAGTQVGPAADVFAWASVIVFAGTGTPPFGEDTLPAIVNRILHQEPQLGDLPAPLRPVVHACLAKDPRDRPAMRDVLLRLLGGQQQHPSPVAQAPISQGPMPHAPKRVAGRFPLVAAVAGAVAVSLAGVSVGAVVIRNAASTQYGGGPLLAAESSGPVTSSTPSAKRGAHKPKKSKTPSADRTTTRPLPTRTKERTTPTPTRTKASVTPTPTRTRPSSTPTTSRPTTSKPASSASFTLANVRVQGSSKINDEGVTCFRGSMNFAAGVDATKPAAPYSYQWIYDGKVIESGSARLPAGSRSDYVHSKDLVEPQDGTHTITYRITSPVSRAKSLTFTMC